MTRLSKTHLLFMRHAEDMLIERDIDREWVRRTVMEPEAIESDPTRPGIMRVFRRIPERDGRILRVVYVSTDDTTARVVTAFFDRSRGR